MKCLRLSTVHINHENIKIMKNNYLTYLLNVVSPSLTSTVSMSSIILVIVPVPDGFRPGVVFDLVSKTEDLLSFDVNPKLELFEYAVRVERSVVSIVLLASTVGLDGKTEAGC